MDQKYANLGSELPKPEQAPAQPRGGEFVVPYPGQPEKMLPNGEHISQAQAASAVAAAVGGSPLVAPQVNDPAAVIPLNNPSQSSTPALADDVDVIEKEWVEKAKDIVAKTKTDPHMQSVELTNFRHDYMKKRYGKEIKLPEDSAA